MTYFFHLGSIFLGLMAWGIPLAAIALKKKSNCCGLSFTCCCCALAFQIFEIKHMIDIGDYSAVMDTTKAISIAVIVLVTGTLIINFAAVRFYKK